MDNTDLESEMERSITDCNNNAGGNTKDFSTVPADRVFYYNTKCYDCDEIVNKFNKTWFQLSFNFTINNTNSISLNTARNLATRIVDYNNSIYESRDEETLYYKDPKTNNIMYGEPVKMSDFMLLFFFYLHNPEISTLAREIIMYNTTKRPRYLVLFLKLIYLFMNQIPLTTVQAIFGVHFKHLLPNLEVEYDYINRMIRTLIASKKAYHRKSPTKIDESTVTQEDTETTHRKSFTKTTGTQEDTETEIDESTTAQNEERMKRDHLSSTILGRNKNFDTLNRCEEHVRSKETLSALPGFDSFLSIPPLRIVVLPEDPLCAHLICHDVSFLVRQLDYQAIDKTSFISIYPGNEKFLNMKDLEEIANV